jgi:hypothetical protein
MRSPALAFAWQVWCRHRLGLSLTAAGWLAAAILCWLLPTSRLDRDAVLPLIVIPSMGVLTYVLAVFSGCLEARLEAAESAFPSRMFSLPLPTRTLAGWPMLLGTAAMLVLWFALAGGVMWPLGFRPPLVWPALGCAATLAWLQALAWFPFGVPWLRLGAVLLLMIAGAALASLVLWWGMPAVLLPALLVVVLAAAYGVALAGVERARRGDAPFWKRLIWIEHSPFPSATRGVQFASAAKAQTWLESRRNGNTMMLFVAGVLVLWLPLLLWRGNGLDELAASGDFPALTAAVSYLSSAGVILAWMLPLPWLLTLTAGGELGRMNLAGKGFAMSGFLACRPMTSGELALVKFRAAAHSTLGAWVVMLVGIGIWLCFGGHYAALAASPFVQQYGVLGATGRAALVVLAFVLLTWLQVLRGLWVGLAGRTWVVTLAICLGLGFLTVATLVGQWLWRRPEAFSVMVEALPWAACTLAVLKLLIAACLLRAIRRRRLWSNRVIGEVLLVWLVVVAAFWGILYTLLPSGGISPLGIALMSFFLVCLNEVLLTPLAVDWNRHR